MKDIAWLLIRTVGLICIILSLKFAVITGALISVAYPYRSYSVISASNSSDPIPPEKDASNPDVQRKFELYHHYFIMASRNGGWFLLLIGSGIYLLRGGKLVHKIITNIPPVDK
ncbi:MAG: hypothetical protein PHD76_14715 [Methylacidiphilales bacterium]|nr:hypothetical protein [Candidatus Methylacidiphilales bacterium]